jgi:hypothetical protein
MRQRIGQIALFGFLVLLTGTTAVALVRSGVFAVRFRHAECQWSVDHAISFGPVGSSTGTDYTDQFDGPDAVRFGIARIAVGTVCGCWCLVCLIGLLMRSEARTSRRRRRFQRFAMLVLMIPATVASFSAELFYFPPWIPSVPTMLATAAIAIILSGTVVLIGVCKTIVGGRRVLSGTAMAIAGLWVLSAAFGHDDHASLAVVFGGLLGVATVSQGLIVRRLRGPEAPAALEPMTPQQVWQEFRGGARPAWVRGIEAGAKPHCPAIP